MIASVGIFGAARKIAPGKRKKKKGERRKLCAIKQGITGSCVARGKNINRAKEQRNVVEDLTTEERKFDHGS